MGLRGRDSGIGIGDSQDQEQKKGRVFDAPFLFGVQGSGGAAERLRIPNPDSRIPALKQIPFRGQRALHAVAQATDLQHQPVDFGGTEAFVGAVFA